MTGSDGMIAGMGCQILTYALAFMVLWLASYTQLVKMINNNTQICFVLNDIIISYYSNID